MKNLDVKTAYLNADLKKIYMSIPDGWKPSTRAEERIWQSNGEKVFLLTKQYMD